MLLLHPVWNWAIFTFKGKSISLIPQNKSCSKRNYYAVWLLNKNTEFLNQTDKNRGEFHTARNNDEMHNEQQELHIWSGKLCQELGKASYGLVISHANTPSSKAICWGLLFNVTFSWIFFSLFHKMHTEVSQISVKIPIPVKNQFRAILEGPALRFSSVCPPKRAGSSIQNPSQPTPSPGEGNSAVLTELKGYFSVLEAPFRPSTEFLV